MRTKEEIKQYQREYKRKIRNQINIPKNIDKQINIEIIKSLYIQENKSVQEIASILQTEEKTITLLLKQFKIEKEYKVGNKFGKLLIIEGPFKFNRKTSRQTSFRCKCDCGREVVIRSDIFKKKIRKACKKCAIIDKTILYGNITRQYWNRIVRGAKSRNIEFLITPEYIDSIFTGYCKLTNRKIFLIKSSYAFHLCADTASLDRIDNTKGYIEGNLRWVHKDANIMKLDYSDEQFITFCCEIADKFRQDNSHKEIDFKNITNQLLESKTQKIMEIVNGSSVNWQ